MRDSLDEAASRVIRPRRLRLEASSVCQLRCPSCPTARGDIDPTIGRGFLSLGDFCGVVDENPWIRQIELSNYGEIFLNPHLASMFEYAHARGVSLTANNGVNFNEASDEALDAMVRFGFREVTCSIDGASQETYGRYRTNGDFARVLENIRKVNSFKRRHRSSVPRLTWQFVVMGFNEHEISIARQMACDLGMRFSLKLSWDEEYSPLRDPERVRREIGCASRDEFRRRHGRDYMQNLCHGLWDQPQINWDGRVLGCCRNFWGEFGGNAFRMGLLPAVNSERLQYARDMLLGRKESRSDVPCASCEIYLQMKASGRWLKRGLLRGAFLAKDRISRLLRHY